MSPVWGRIFDFVAERAEGSYIFTTDGRRLLDFTCGIGVTNTGHCHPKVVAAIREQAGLFLHAQANIVIHKPMLQLIEELRRIVPAPIDGFFFSNSGAEAIEGAVKLARVATGRPERHRLFRLVPRPDRRDHGTDHFKDNLPGRVRPSAGRCVRGAISVCLSPRHERGAGLGVRAAVSWNTCWHRRRRPRKRRPF